MPVSRLFVEVGKGVDRMNESLRQAITTAQASGAEFGRITASGQAFIAKMQDALNPTAKFREQLDLLRASGMQQGDVWKVMGEQLTRAAEDSRKMGQAIDPTVQKMLDFGKSADKSGFSVENLGKTITDFARNPVEGAKTAVTGFLGTLGPTAVGLGGVATALGAAGVAVFKFVDSLASSMERLQNLSAMTGITTQSLEAFEQIAKNAGLESLDLGRTIGMLNKNLGDSDPNEFTKAMKEMGISITDAAGHTKDAITILDEMRDALLGVEDPTMRAQLAQQVLGGRLRELIPLLLNSSKSLKDARDEMEQFGITTDDVTKQRLAALDEAIDRSSTRITGWWHQFELAILNSRTLGSILSGLAGEMDELTEAEKAQREEASKRLYVARAESELDAYAKDRLKELTEQRKAATEAEDKWIKECEKAAQSTVAASAATGSLAEATERAKASLLSLDQIYAQFLDNLKKEKSPYSSVIANIYELEAAANRGQEALSKLPVLDRGVIDRDLEPQLRKVPKLFDDTAKEAKSAWDRQISTIGTDLSRSIADGIMSGKIKILDAIRNIGSALLRALIETFVDPFMKAFSSLLNGLFSRIDFGSLLPSIGTGGIGGIGGASTAAKSAGGFASLGILPAIGGGIAGSAGLGGLLGGGIGGKVAGGVAGYLGVGAGSSATGILGGSMGAWIGALGAAAPWLAAAVGLAYGIPKLISAVQGKNSYQAGGMESLRDFGVGLSSADMKTFLSGKGISESTAYPIRKDIASSPAYLTQLGGIAKQQGTYDTFLSKLENVTTAWGTFNFRKAYEIGDLTGDWSALDKAFTDAFSSSKKLQENIPNWKELLTITGDAVKKTAAEFETLWQSFESSGEMTQELSDFLTANATSLDEAAKASAAFAEQLDKARASAAKWTELKPVIDGLSGLKAALEQVAATAETSIYQSFLDTGKMTDELAAKIKEFGGDLAAFEKLSGLVSIRNEFETLRDTFLQTREVTDRLREIFTQFGGNLKVLDDAAKLPGLTSGLNSINSLRSSIKSLMDDPVMDILSGKWTEKTWGALANLNLDPMKLTGLADVSKFKSEWDRALTEFQSGTKKKWDVTQNKYVDAPIGLVKGGVLEQAIYKYGGEEGKKALLDWAKGFNTITPALLEKVKSGVDKDFQDTLQKSMDYLGAKAKETATEIETLTAAVNTQFETVYKNIQIDIQKAAKDVVDQLVLILAKLNETVTTVTPTSTTAAPSPKTGSVGSGSSDDGGERSPAPTYNIYIENAYGLDDLDTRVAQSITRTVRRGGLAVLTPARGR
jgi:hypothetical protein